MSKKMVYIAVNADAWGISTFSIAEAIADAFKNWHDKPNAKHDRPRIADHWLFSFEGEPSDFVAFDWSEAKPHISNPKPGFTMKEGVEIQSIDRAEFRQYLND